MKSTILLCLLLCNCAKETSRPTSKNSDCEVYQLVLREIVSPQGPYVVLDSTQPIFDSIQLPDDSIARAIGIQTAIELAQTFCQLNAHSAALDSCIYGLPGVTIESRSSVDRLLNLDSIMQYGWRLFYDRYPKSSGLVYLSRVGYSSDGRYCVVCVGNQKESTSGIGFEVYLKYDGARWSIVHRSVSWIS